MAKRPRAPGEPAKTTTLSREIQNDLKGFYHGPRSPETSKCYEEINAIRDELEARGLRLNTDVIPARIHQLGAHYLEETRDSIREILKGAEDPNEIGSEDEDEDENVVEQDLWESEGESEKKVNEEDEDSEDDEDSDTTKS